MKLNLNVFILYGSRNIVTDQSNRSVCVDTVQYCIVVVFLKAPGVCSTVCEKMYKYVVEDLL